MNFNIDSERREYRIWWEEAYDSLNLELAPIDVLGTCREVRTYRIISSQYRGWYPFSETLGDGLYQMRITADDGTILRDEEIWVGPRGKVAVLMEPWIWDGYSKITVCSRLKLTRKDYCFRTEKRGVIRASGLMRSCGRQIGYTAEFLLNVTKTSELEMILNDEMTRRLGMPKIEKK